MAGPFPTMESYLARLPAGLASYPEHVAKVSIARCILDAWPEIAAVSSALPDPLRRFIEAPPPTNVWMPEVHAECLWLLGLDVKCGGDPATFDRWGYDVNHALLAQPIYRAVFGILGGRLTVRAIGAAWSSFHRGVTQDVEMKGNSGTITLRGPPHLLPPPLAPSYATAYRAGLAVAGLPGATAKVIETTSTSMQFSVSWAS